MFGRLMRSKIACVVFTELGSMPIQYLSRNVCMSVCVCVCAIVEDAGGPLPSMPAIIISNEYIFPDYNHHLVAVKKI